MNLLRRHLILLETTEPIQFITDFHSYHHGQSDATLKAMLGRTVLGTLDYSVYNNQPSIKMITSHVQRQGIGTALVQHLQQEFPDTEIGWGMTTPEGTALYNSLTFIDIPNKDYLRISKRLVQLEQLEKRLTSVQDEIAQLPTQEERQQHLLRLGDRWNRVNDAVYRLEDQLRSLEPITRIIDTKR